MDWSSYLYPECFAHHGMDNSRGKALSASANGLQNVHWSEIHNLGMHCYAPHYLSFHFQSSSSHSDYRLRILSENTLPRGHDLYWRLLGPLVCAVLLDARFVDYIWH